MLKVALTGGIATGKSYCLARFHALGAPTIDADSIARDVVAPHSDGLAAVIDRFGPAVLRDDGALDRGALGRIVFADPDARRDLEAIVHPRVYAAILAWFARLAASHPAPAAAIADIPLIYETGRASEVDAIVVAACRPDQQLARLLARGGLTDAEARQRIAAQWPIADKAARADYVIDTSGTFEKTDRQVLDVWTALSGRARRRP